jgi:CheY-like chemotaxis protein
MSSNLSAEEIRSLVGMNVLLVEDVDDARDMLALLLAMHGAVVVATASAPEALHAFERHAFQVLVSDIGLPGANGYALIRAIRRSEAKRGGFLPAIAVTAFTSKTDRAEALAAGFQLHVSKPVAVEELVAVIAELVEAA